MFLLDPSEGLTREELLQHTWHRVFTPAQRTEVLHLAESRGLTWLEWLREAAAAYDAAMADPVQREAWRCTHEEMERQQAMPLGCDPRLGKEEHDDI